MRFNTTFRAFTEITSLAYKDQYIAQIISDIEGQEKDYLLGVDEESYINYLIEKYSFKMLSVHEKSEAIGTPEKSKEWVGGQFYGEKFYSDVYTFTITYAYTGSAQLFRVQPDQRFSASTMIHVHEPTQTVSFTLKVCELDEQEFKRIKKDEFDRAFANVLNINMEAQSWNLHIPNFVRNVVRKEKAKYESENAFFKAINVRINPDTQSVFTAPTLQKKIIPQPTASKEKRYLEPTMASEMYDDLLKVTYDFGKSMEKKPSLYFGKDEESLRDQFLVLLETRYDGTTASGETFNRGGKTDIILKYAADGSNLFIAECKVWHGGSEFLKAISQLFNRYLTWRDSKVALILFVTNKDFTATLKTVKSEIVKHPYFNKENGTRGESSFSYLFHLPQDKDKLVYFEVILFHFDNGGRMAST